MSHEPILPSVKSHPKSTKTKWTRMGSWLLALLTFNLSLLIIQSCGLDIEDPTPPSPPVWVQKSLPEEWPEQGIDAHESGGIYLQWIANPEESNMRYKIYRAENLETINGLGDMELIAVFDQTGNNKLEYVDNNVQVDKVLYYSIVCIGEAQIESIPSDTINFRLQRPIRSDMMLPNGISQVLPTSRTLDWQNFYIDNTEEYCLTILSEEGHLIHRCVLQPQNYMAGHEKWDIPLEITLESDKYYKWRIDTGARFIEGLETWGSESPWATFKYSVVDPIEFLSHNR
jgi:hypothetical protein